MFRLKVSNFAALKQLDFSPEGVCLLVGPNGGGKTTLLRVLHILKVGAQQSLGNAIVFRTQPRLRSLSADPDARVLIEIAVADVTWEIEVGYGRGEQVQTAETITHAGLTLAKRQMGQTITDFRMGQEMRFRDDDQRSALKLLWDVVAPPEIAPLMTWLQDLRSYLVTSGLATWSRLRPGMFDVNDVNDQFLSQSYDNAFTVLRNWRDTRKQRPRFDWVMEELRRLFPRDFYELEFQPEVGVFLPGQDQAIRIAAMSDGFLSVLMHLVAAAGMKQGGLLAIDQIEDNLHPAAIGGLMAALRRLAKERQFSVLLTSHSPYAMNLFDAVPEQVYVLEPAAAVQPVRLTELHDPAWLAHFKLGSLYGVEFAKQARSSTEESADGE